MSQAQAKHSQTNSSSSLACELIEPAQVHLK